MRYCLRFRRGETSPRACGTRFGTNVVAKGLPILGSCGLHPPPAKQEGAEAVDLLEALQKGDEQWCKDGGEQAIEADCNPRKGRSHRMLRDHLGGADATTSRPKQRGPWDRVR